MYIQHRHYQNNYYFIQALVYSVYAINVQINFLHLIRCQCRLTKLSSTKIFRFIKSFPGIYGNYSLKPILSILGLRAQSQRYCFNSQGR
jgi:hypothetical protein